MRHYLGDERDKTPLKVLGLGYFSSPRLSLLNYRRLL